MAVGVKICGLTRAVDVAAAVEAGADYVGAVLARASRRAVDIEALPALFAPAAGRARRVAVTVDADDALLDRLAALGTVDLVQLHGAESPERVLEVRRRTGLDVIKALAVAAEGDLVPLAGYVAVADVLLFDAKPAPGAPPGGNGLAFDWRVIANVDAGGKPWGLAGGLDATNVEAAVVATRPRFVDVASGVEVSAGVKDPARIRAFVAAARRTAPEKGSTE